MGVVEFLRPFVETNAWDYVVVWKYGNDPTRFIEWFGCCCCGGNIEKLKLKEEMSEQNHLASICRDTLFHHPVKTKTCEALAKLPITMSLYSSVHAEVAISQQPRWLIHEESVGTQVLIPIIGGLVELFAAKHIPEDINTMKFISAHCCISINQDAVSAHSYTDMNFNFSMEGHFGESNPSTEHLSFDSNYGCLIPLEYLNQPLKSQSHRRNKISVKHQRGSSVHCGNGEENIVKEPREKVYHAKNLITERNRRNRIKQGLFTLRSLVPNITKMDRVAILEDAIEYIMELQRQEKELQEEVKALEVEDCGKSTLLQIRVQKDKELAEGTINLPLIDLNQSSSDSTRKAQMEELQVEVNHIAGKDFLIKLCCEQKQGVFSRLMEAIDSFGLHVLSANMTTFDGKVLNIIMVEATAQDIQPKKLREYLMQKTR